MVKEAVTNQTAGAEAVIVDDYEAGLPGWQRHLNIFCENWIFAVLVALLIRHFLVEPFRIPTASMEPMLYGDPAFTQGDFVVVDKITTRFMDPDRFDVIVFQYPVPEVDLGRPDPGLAEHGDGRRIDRFPFRPLYERNFVKRCLVLPGEVFYLANGDLFVRSDDGIFRVVSKPDKIQQALWLPIYRQGSQEGYLPWAADGGAQVEPLGTRLRITGSAGGGVAFTQPFSNFYLKPGKARVQPRSPALSDIPATVVPASMLAPMFEFATANGTTLSGDLWDLDNWWVTRLTTADYDDASRATRLNSLMDEMVGDVRVGFTVGALTGPMSLHLDEGKTSTVRPDESRRGNTVRLDLDPSSGWSLTVNGQQVAVEASSPVGRELVLWLADDHCGLAVDGVERLPDGIPLVAINDEKDGPLKLRWEGVGSVTLDGLALHRDVHYSSDGFLSDQAEDYERYSVDYDEAFKANLLGKADDSQTLRYRIRRLREQIIPCILDESLRAECLKSMERSVSNRRNTTWLQPLGVSPETALRLPEDGYLMLGDNSPLSMDGRSWGWVPGKNIRGRVIWVAFPFGRTRVVR